MAYDRDSFLAGLAVGRTLWRPHRETQGEQYMSVPCYPTLQGVNVNWTSGGNEFTQFMLDKWLLNPWPTPTYWFVWHDTDSDTWRWFLFSPDTSWQQNPYIGIYIKGYNAGWENVYGFMYSGTYIANWSDAIRTRGQIDFSVVGASSEDFKVLGYFEGDYNALERFGRTTRLVQVGNQLRLIGVIP